MSKPHLKDKAAFQRILSNYHISEEGEEMLRDINLALMVAPTSVGKNTIIDRLVHDGPYETIVSDTTRPPRVENGKLEEHGVRYFFRKEEELLADLEAGLFLEASLIHNQQVSGISLRELKNAADHNKIAINEIEVIGADKVHQAKEDAHIVFILPPSFDEWLRRLKHRGEMTEDEIRNRTESMRFELEYALERDFFQFVVNDDLEEAIKNIRDIVENDHYDEEAQKHGRWLATELLRETNKALFQ